MILFLYTVTLAGVFALVTCFGELIGAGKWMVHNVEDLPNNEQYTLRPKCRRNKLNRTHDCFQCDVDLEFDLDKSYGLYMDIYKKVDGGYKPYMVMEYDCLCCILKEKAKENFEKVLRLVNVDPPECPVPKGSYIMRDFVFDYRELKERCVFGIYSVYIYVTKGSSDNKLGGVVMNLEYDKNRLDDDDK